MDFLNSSFNWSTNCGRMSLILLFFSSSASSYSALVIVSCGMFNSPVTLKSPYIVTSAAKEPVPSNLIEPVTTEFVVNTLSTDSTEPDFLK